MRETLFIPLLLLITQIGSAQDGNVLSLGVNDCISYAWENSQKAKTAAIEVQQADKDVWIQAARGLPIVNGSVSFNNFIDLPTSVFDASSFNPLAPPGELQELQFGQPYTMDAGVTASLQLFDGSYIIGLKGATGYKKLTRDMQKMTKNEIETMIAESYYTAQVAKENVALLKQNVRTTETTLNETRELYDEGFTEEMDVEQLDLLMNSLQNKLKMAERQHEASLNLLKYQMGMPIDTKIELKDELETLWNLQPADELLGMELDLNTNLAYDLVKQDIVLHGYLIKLEESKYYPSLTAFFDYKQQAFRQKFDFYDFNKSWYPQTLWGIKLNVPIWDNLGGLASIRKAKLEQQKVKNKLADMEQALIMQTTTSKNNFISALEQLETSSANIRLATRIKEKTLVKFQEGLASSMDLTNAENQLIQAQTEYINALFQAMDAKLELKKVLENN